MIDTLNLLTTSQVAEFAAKGCLRFDGLIDSDLNQEFLDLFAEDIGSAVRPNPNTILEFKIQRK